MTSLCNTIRSIWSPFKMDQIRNLAAFMLFVLLAGIAFPQNAEAGFGNVWATQTTHNSATIDWDDPSGRLRHSNPQNPSYKIVYRTFGLPKTVLTMAKPYQITGLNPSTPYLVSVYTYTVRKFLGKWRWPGYRKVDTFFLFTNPANGSGSNSGSGSNNSSGSGNISVVNSTDHSITVKVTYSHPHEFDMIRVAYKKSWSSVSLKSKAKDRAKPSAVWGTNNQRRGWEDQPAGSSLTFSFSNLKKCRTYKFVAYGFKPSNNLGVQIGTIIKGSTGGGCKTSDIADGFISESLYEGRPVLKLYLETLDDFYKGSSVFEHVALLDSSLVRERQVLEQDGEDLNDNLTAISYLYEAHPDLFDVWQSDPELQAVGLNLDQFVKTQAPDLYQALWNEINPLSESMTKDSCLYAIDFSGSNTFPSTTLYRMDPNTGQASNPKNTGIDEAIGIEWGTDGYLYAVTNGGGVYPITPAGLYRIDPASGASQFIGSLGLGTIYEGDLALNPVTGVLYGISGDGTLFKMGVTGQARRVFRQRKARANRPCR